MTLDEVVLSSADLLVLGESDCRRLLALATVGRVVLSVDALPAAFPVNYQLVGNAITFRTAPGTKLSAALNGTVVAFEIDDLDPAQRRGWSVLVVGPSRVVTDSNEVAVLDRLSMHSWVGSELPHYVKIEAQQISGRQLPTPTT